MTLKKRNHGFFLIGVIIFFVGCFVILFMFVAPTRSESTALPAFEGPCALKHVIALTDIGKRPGASANARKAADYLKAQFEAYGYQVVEQRFPMNSFEEKNTKLSIQEPNALEIPASAVIYSPSGHLTAEVVAVPLPGIASNFRRADLKSKIALVRRGEISNTEKIACAARAGALAVLIYNNSPQEFLSFNWGGPAPIPALWLSGTDGEKLLASINTGPVMMRLDSDTLHEQREGINIVATHPGKSNKTLVFGAHYDSVTNNSPGANDNASGVAVVLELARILAQTDRPETLVFIGFDGEEEGTLGSLAYVQQLTSAKRKAIQIMFNFDEVGAGDSPFGFGGNRALAKKAVKAAVQRGLKMNAAFSEGGGSDHAPFVEAGIDSLWIFQYFPIFHSAQDSPEKISPDALEASGNIVLDLLKE